MYSNSDLQVKGNISKPVFIFILGFLTIFLSGFTNECFFYVKCLVLGAYVSIKVKSSYVSYVCL